jgi:hypothetical protein
MKAAEAISEATFMKAKPKSIKDLQEAFRVSKSTVYTWHDMADKGLMGSSYQEMIVRKKKDTYTAPAVTKLFAANQSAVSPQLFLWGNLKPIPRKRG